MALWNIDLTTEDGALGAAQMGGAACLVGAVLGVLGAVSAGGILSSQGQSGVVTLVIAFAMAEVLVFAIAGFRLRAGKGVLLGAAAALLLALELLVKVATLSVIGIIIDAILLIVVINGIRGAQALHKGGFDAEETAEIFN